MNKKRKKIKQRLVFLLLLTMFGFVSNVRAAETRLTEQATLTITGVDAGDTLAAYKVLDAYKNETTNEIIYHFTDNFRNFINQSEKYGDLTEEKYYDLTSGNIENGSTQTNSTLDTLASAYATYVKKQNVEGIDMITNATNATLTTEVGTYLILPKITTRVYAVMVGNLDYKEQSGVWVKNNATIVAKVSDVSIEKSVGNKTSQTTSGQNHQEFTYYITGTVPQFPTNAINRKYIIKDTLSTGLTHSGMESITIKEGEENLVITELGIVEDSAGNHVADIKIEGQVMTIEFDVTRINSTKINVTYKARLNDEATLGAEGNTNDAKLIYANDPYGNQTSETPTKKATVYTYGLKIFKYRAGDATKKGLKGAKFDIYSDRELTTKVGELTTDETGYGSYQSLGEGTYYLKEGKAPTGYVVSKNAVEIEISKASVEEGYQLVEITNNAAGLLPFTGGMGTIVYTIIGLIIIAGASIGIVSYKKSKSR